MDIREFGDKLIWTGDLDPVYVAIYNAQLPEPQLCRLLLAYWCFYHLGVAAWISEHEPSTTLGSTGFWGRMTIAALNEMGPRDHPDCPSDSNRWPRASERRHFRGTKCVRAVEQLTKRFTQPEDAVRTLAQRATEVAVMRQVETWPMFGPWIAFKAADMMERVYGAQVRFSRDTGLMYAEPRAGLKLASEQGLDGQGGLARGLPEREIYDNLLTYFSARKAPGGTPRQCGPQEVETVLCKWKSHMRGHYEVGKDIREVRHALGGWGQTAERLLAAAPEEIE